MLRSFLITFFLLPFCLLHAQQFEKVDEIPYYMLSTNNYISKWQIEDHGLIFRSNIQKKMSLEYPITYYDADGRKIESPKGLIRKHGGKLYMLGNAEKPHLTIYGKNGSEPVEELDATIDINTLINKKPEKKIPETARLLSYEVINDDQIVYTVRHTRQVEFSAYEYTDYTVLWNFSKGTARAIIPEGFPAPAIADAYEKDDPEIAVWNNAGYYNGLVYYTRKYTLLNKKTDAFESCLFSVAAFDENGKLVNSFNIDAGLSPTLAVPEGNNKINKYKHVINVSFDTRKGHFYTYCVAEKGKSFQLVLTKTAASGKQVWKTEQPANEKLLKGPLGYGEISLNYSGKVILYFIHYTDRTSRSNTKYIFSDVDGTFLKADPSALALEKDYENMRNKLSAFLQNNKDLSLEDEYEQGNAFSSDVKNIFLIGEYYYITLKGPKRTYLIYRYKI